MSRRVDAVCATVCVIGLIALPYAALGAFGSEAIREFGQSEVGREVLREAGREVLESEVGRQVTGEVVERIGSFDLSALFPPQLILFGLSAGGLTIGSVVFVGRIVDPRPEEEMLAASEEVEPDYSMTFPRPARFPAPPPPRPATPSWRPGVTAAPAAGPGRGPVPYRPAYPARGPAPAVAHVPARSPVPYRPAVPPAQRPAPAAAQPPRPDQRLLQIQAALTNLQQRYLAGQVSEAEFRKTMKRYREMAQQLQSFAGRAPARPAGQPYSAPGRQSPGPVAPPARPPTAPAPPPAYSGLSGRRPLPKR